VKKMEISKTFRAGGDANTTLVVVIPQEIKNALKLNNGDYVVWDVENAPPEAVKEIRIKKFVGGRTPEVTF